MMKRTPEEERIYEALSAVKTPEAPLEAGVRARLERRERHNRPYFRMAVAAACLVVMLGAVVGAAGLSDAWRYFFPSVPEDAVTRVGVSQTVGDYTLTVEDAVADDTGALLLLSLTRTDGAELDPNLQLGGGSPVVNPALLLDGKAVDSSGGVVEQTLSGDGKTLYLVYEAANSQERLSGKTITFTVPALSDGVESRQTTVSLAALADAAVAESQENIYTWGQTLSQEDCRVELPAAGTFVGGALRGALETEKGLILAIESGEQRGEDMYCLGARSSALVDTRTGTRYEFAGFTSTKLDDGTFVMLHSYEDCPLTAADLPWLELELSYPVSHLATEKPFELSFQVDTSAARTVPLETTEILGTVCPLRELRLSAREIALDVEGDGLELYAFLYEGDAAAMELTWADGTTRTVPCNGGRVYEGVCTFWYTPDLSTRSFLDPEGIVSVTIGDVTFDLP